MGSARTQPRTEIASTVPVSFNNWKARPENFYPSTDPSASRQFLPHEWRRARSLRAHEYGPLNQLHPSEPSTVLVVTEGRVDAETGRDRDAVERGDRPGDAREPAADRVGSGTCVAVTVTAKAGTILLARTGIRTASGPSIR